MRARYYPGVKDLADALRAAMNRRGVNSRKVAALSGDRIGHTAIAKLLNAQVGNPGIFTIQAIARGLGVSPLELCAAALGEDVDADRRREHQLAALIRDYRLLSERDRRKLDLLLEVFDLALFQSRLAPAHRPSEGRHAMVA
jgi:transcriptional regulator with XRE-family HTH domain